MFIAGTQYAAGYGLATVYPDFDFETYSEAGLVWSEALQKWKPLPGMSDQNKGLKATGVRPYVEHPSFFIRCMAWDLKDGKGGRSWDERLTVPMTNTVMVRGRRQPWPADLLEYVARGGILEAHRSGFEWHVWTYYCVRVLGWPPLPIEQTRCSMAKSRAFALPGALADVGNVLNIEHKKFDDGDRLVKKWTMPRAPTKTNPRLILMPEDDPEDYQRFVDYNKRDPVSESEVSVMVPDLSPTELTYWLADQRINARGMQVASEDIDNCISIVEQAWEKYDGELFALTGCHASEVAKLQTWLHGQGCPMMDLTEASVTDMIGRIEQYAADNQGDLGPFSNACRALHLRAMLSSASVKKLWPLKYQQHNGRIYDLYNYHAARTGRPTAYGPQPANLYKGEWNKMPPIERALSVLSTRCLEYVEYEYPKIDPITVVNNCLRSLIIAAPGMRLVSSDYSAIEGVVTAAIAGCEWRLDVFRTHGMMYEASAARIVGEPFENFVRHRLDTGGKATYDAHGKLLSIVGGKHHPMRNKQGKFCELSLGYGGWIGAMKGFGADKFMDEIEMKSAILSWRDASPEIVELWGGQSRGRFDDAYPELFGLEGAAVSAVKWPGSAFWYKTVAFQMLGDVLYMRLPSGRLLTYHKPRLAPSTRPYARSWEEELSFSGQNSNPKKGPLGWIRMKLYGGLITENLVQAVARDIFWNAVVALEARGYAIVYHNYDEVVAEVPKGWGSVEELEAIMNIMPDFATGWPVSAKGGWEGQSYGKFD